MSNDPFLQFNMSHTIHRLSFGHDFPGREDPLDGHAEVVERGEGLPGENNCFTKFNSFLDLELCTFGL